MSAEYPGATYVPCPGFGFPNGSRGRLGHVVRWIILHGTASGDGTAEEQARFFSRTAKHGVHFVIGKDGKVIQLVALADAAYGNGILQQPHDSWWTASVNPNLVTVSIEHCKVKHDNSDVLTPEQQAASFKLVKWLCEHFNIPGRKADASGGITGHFSIEGIDRKHCPGPYPWDALFDFLGGSMVPQGPFVFPTIGKEIPTGTTFRQIITGFGLTDSDFTTINDWAKNYNLELPIQDGTEVKLPGYVVTAPAGVDATLQQLQAANTSLQNQLQAAEARASALQQQLDALQKTPPAADS
ncbi:MAG TPA: N-acetylmuramoyl-L-alanine amidase [Ktedonobacterales bacterium]|jgi:hypothetical protein